LAQRDIQLIDNAGERDSIALVEQFKHFDVGEKIGITRHGGSSLKEQTEAFKSGGIIS